MHAKLEAVLCVFADGKVLDDEFESIGEPVIDGLDGADALGRDLGVVDLHAEGEHRQNGHLVGRVVAVDVECGIRFGVTFRLGLGEGLREGKSVLTHARQDVVRGSVDDAVERFDRVARECLP